MKSGKLYLIPTILAEGKFDTIPVQVRTELKRLSYFLVENVRTSRRYISGLKLGLRIEDLEFKELSKKTLDSDVAVLMKPVLEGESVGILSESGCPGIADPGAKAVTFAHEHNIEVVPLVGPTSVVLALMGSGMNGQKFTFNGYLPIKSSDLQRKIRELEQTSAKEYSSEIFIETPYRNNQLLENIIKIGNPETRLCIAKDLTGENEFIKTMSLRKWKSQKIDLHKIPCIYILQAS